MNKVPVLMIGRGGSRGVPGKNTMMILGRPLMEYPILAAKYSKHVGDIYLSTDAESIKKIGQEHHLKIIERPAELCSDTALVEDVVVHGYEQIVRMSGNNIEMIVLLFCNTATITPGLIDKGIEMLREDTTLDSAVSVSLYNEYSPVRARKITSDGFIVPYIDTLIDNASCDRDSAEPCYFCDCSIWVLRSNCMNISEGILPFRWMGHKSVPLYQQGGLDIDHDYGISMTVHWLQKHGFSEKTLPY
jgi:CMP-N-acetylneuraminic acid synthetase